MTADQAMQAFMDPSGYQPQYVFNSRPKGKLTTKAKNVGKRKMKIEPKGKKTKEAKDPLNEKGKRPAKQALTKEGEAKRIKMEASLNIDMVNSFNSPSAETGSIQSRRME